MAKWFEVPGPHGGRRRRRLPGSPPRRPDRPRPRRRPRRDRGRPVLPVPRGALFISVSQTVFLPTASPRAWRSTHPVFPPRPYTARGARRSCGSSFKQLGQEDQLHNVILAYMAGSDERVQGRRCNGVRGVRQRLLYGVEEHKGARRRRGRRTPTPSMWSPLFPV